MPRQTRRQASAAVADVGSDQGESPSVSDSTTSDATSFFNTTFSLHRVSPLFLGSEALGPERLQLLAARLRDTLVGDVVRGVEVGLHGDDAALGNAGALEAVTIGWATAGSVVTAENKALQLSLQYENALSIALLLPSPEGNQGGAAFAHLPLLLCRMSTPLKAVVTDFLSATFDCRISPLRLGNSDVVEIWEAWIQEAGLPTSGLLAKDVVLTLGFRLPEVKKPTDDVAADADADLDVSDGIGIKSIDIILPSHDLRRFLQAGQTLDRRGVADARRPFSTAVARYIQHQLALDMSHPGVRITRIASGGFVLSEGRLKIFALPDGTIATSTHLDAVKRLVGDLVYRAKRIMPPARP